MQKCHCCNNVCPCWPGRRIKPSKVGPHQTYFIFLFPIWWICHCDRASFIEISNRLSDFVQRGKLLQKLNRADSLQRILSLLPFFTEKCHCCNNIGLYGLYMQDLHQIRLILLELILLLILFFTHFRWKFKCKNVIVVIMSACCWPGWPIEPSWSVGPPKHISPCYAQFGVFIIAIEPPFLVRTQAFIWYTPHESNDPCNQLSAKNSSIA